MPFRKWIGGRDAADHEWSYQIRRAEDVAWAVARAFYIARSGRPSPVVLVLPRMHKLDKTEYEPVKWISFAVICLCPKWNGSTTSRRTDQCGQTSVGAGGAGRGTRQCQEQLRAFHRKADIPCRMYLLGLSALQSPHPE